MLVTGEAVTEGDEHLVMDWRQRDDAWLWVDLCDEPLQAESAFLQRTFGFDEFDVNSAQRTRYPPGISLSKSYIYLLLKPLDAASHDLDFSTLQLALFVGERFIVTRRSRESAYLERLWSTMVADNDSLDSPFAVVTAMARRITERYAGVLLNLENRLDVIEDEIFTVTGDALMRELVGYNTSLRKMRRIIAYHQNTFRELAGSAQVKSVDGLGDEIDDITSMMSRNTSLADLYQSVITDLIEGYISLNGHRLNQIMKVLTIVTVLFVPITFLAGIYGMNFENMPELKTANGYYILLSIMLTIVGILLYVFRRIRWL